MDYVPSLNIIELRAKARKWVKTWRNRPAQNGKPECKDGLIIIDYLQLMNGVKDNMNSQTRDQELSIISRSLKTLAGELQVPIIALSQMSREIEKRQGGKPKLSDLRESGAIEQDADIVAFLQREDYEQADYEVDEMDKDKAFIWFKKHRNGRLERVTMRTALEVQRWLTPDQYDLYQRNLKSLREIVGNGKGPNMFRSPVVDNENEGDPF
jgi:replicative DNA helicase